MITIIIIIIIILIIIIVANPKKGALTRGRSSRRPGCQLCFRIVEGVYRLGGGPQLADEQATALHPQNPSLELARAGTGVWSFGGLRFRV